MTTYTEQEMQDIVKRMMENLKRETEDNREKNTRPPDFENITRIPEFRYDKDAGNTFKRWFERYQNLIEPTLSDDTARARFVTSKLGTDEYNQFANSIIPQRIMDLEYEELIEELSCFFDPPSTLFRRRLKLFETTVGTSTYRELWGRIKNQSALSELKTFSTEDLLSFIAINALKGPEHQVARLRALTFLETHEDASFDELLDDLEQFEAIRRDALGETHRYASSINKIQGAQGGPGPSRGKFTCYRCGGTNHDSNKCKFRNETCNYCKKKGHLAKVCNLAKKQKNGKRNQKNGNTVNEVKTELKINMIYTTVNINGLPVKMVLDTGAQVTLINHETWVRLGKPHLKQATIKLTVANGSTLKTYGRLHCQVGLRSSTFEGNCYVTDECSLLGIDWIKQEKNGQLLNPDLLAAPVNSVTQKAPKDRTEMKFLAKLQKTFPTVFDDELGKCLNYEAKITLKTGAKPIFRKARPVAYATLPDVAKEIARLEKASVIERTDNSLFAAPVVVVRKSNGTIRLCADYSTGLNAEIEDDTYPLPTAEDIFSTLNGGKFFSKIDLSEAYLQVPVEESSQKLLTINTTKGLYKMKRLPFGIKTAPSIFQRLMDTMTADLEGTTAYLDDIIITSETREQHESRLYTLFQRLAEFGMKARLDKCSFLQTEIKYLGFVINEEGRKPDPDKIRPITEMPRPKNITQLRAFLGMVTFYSAFVPDMASIREPLNKLLKKNTNFEWNDECETAFNKTKAILQSDLLLTHFNPDLPMIVSADASGYGIGSVLLHRFPDGSLKAVQHAARALTDVEQKYSQIEKESLALVFAVRKFHKYIYGRKFILNTDHKPLISIFKPGNGISAHSANRLQRWALTLVDYNFEIQYKNTKDFGEADALSRLIHDKQNVLEEEDKVIASIEADAQHEFDQNIKRMTITAEDIRRETLKSQVLQMAIKYTSLGQWPKVTKENELFTLASRKENLSIINDCLLYGTRVVVPESLKEKVLQTLHEGHPGMTRMKRIAREYCYWINIDKDIEKTVTDCDQCQLAGKMPRRVPLEPWPNPERPWKRVHADYAGPLMGWHYLIIVDAFSKWPEVLTTKKITAESTVDLFDEVFSRHGYPEELVTDNGRQFCATMTKDFCVQRGVRQIFTAPYCPMSNGKAERFVDTFKRSLQKMKEEEGTLPQKIRTILRTYRTTPNRTIGDKTPAELFLGRKPRSKLDLLVPVTERSVNSVEASTRDYKRRMKDDYDRHHGAKPKSFREKQRVYTTKFQNNKTFWVPGVVKSRTGSVNYEVEVEGGVVQKHANQMKSRSNDKEPTPDIELAMMELAISLPFLRKPRRTTARTSSEREPQEGRTEATQETTAGRALAQLERQIVGNNLQFKRAMDEAILAIKEARQSMTNPEPTEQTHSSSCEAMPAETSSMEFESLTMKRELSSSILPPPPSKRERDVTLLGIPEEPTPNKGSGPATEETERDVNISGIEELNGTPRVGGPVEPVPPNPGTPPSNNTDDKSTDPTQPAKLEADSDSNRVGFLQTRKQKKQLKTTPISTGNSKPGSSTKRKATSPIERAKHAPRRH